MTPHAPPRLRPAGYSGRFAAAAVGISYRQLDYWARTDLVRPSLVDATGSGSRRRYSRSDLTALALIRLLLDSGIRLDAVRTIVDHLPADWDRDPDAYLLVSTAADLGAPPVVIAGDGELDALMSSLGRGPVLVFSVAQVAGRVNTEPRAAAGFTPRDCDGLALPERTLAAVGR